MKTGRNYKFWFCAGSQDLYGMSELSILNKSGMFLRDYMETNLDYQ